jgi:hypothetical protein
MSTEVRGLLQTTPRLASHSQSDALGLYGRATGAKVVEIGFACRAGEQTAGTMQAATTGRMGRATIAGI